MRLFRLIPALMLIMTTGCRFSDHSCEGEDTQLSLSFSPPDVSVITEHTPLLITPDDSNVLAICFASTQTDQGEQSYVFTIDEDIDFSTLQMAVHSGTATDNRINGHKVTPIPASFFTDTNYLLYEIGPYTNKGENTISLLGKATAERSVHPVYVIGSFHLMTAEHGFVISKPSVLQTGDWAGQGMPFYAESITYSKIYDIKQTGRTYLYIPDWTGEKIVVIINKAVAVQLTEKTEDWIDISSHISSGENRIDIKLYGWRENLTGPFFLTDTVLVASPDGRQYTFKPTGMQSEFKLRQ